MKPFPLSILLIVVLTSAFGMALRTSSVQAEGNLIIGKDGPGAAILWGAANTANPTQLEVVDPQAGLCEIGREFDGGVSLDEGGLLRCRTIQLGRVARAAPAR